MTIIFDQPVANSVFASQGRRGPTRRFGTVDEVLAAAPRAEIDFDRYGQARVQ